MPGVLHFEIPVDDLDRAKTFYGTVFGCDLQTIPMPGVGGCTTAVTTPVDRTRSSRPNRARSTAG